MDDQGVIRPENRPLTLDIHASENEGIPIPMPRDRTYRTVGSYVNALLLCHDNRLHHQPNAVNSASDCVSQMSAHAPSARRSSIKTKTTDLLLFASRTCIRATSLWTKSGMCSIFSISNGPRSSLPHSPSLHHGSATKLRTRSCREHTTSNAKHSWSLTNSKKARWGRVDTSRALPR